MTDPAPWIKFQRSHQVHVIGSFENEYGERYVIWRNENGDTPYFTGDEVDWEPKNRLLGADFRFNADERAKIAAILWRVPEDFMLNGEAPGPDVTYSRDTESDEVVIKWRELANRPALSWDAARPEGA